jgi:hypothetical protein
MVSSVIPHHLSWNLPRLSVMYCIAANGVGFGHFARSYLLLFLHYKVIMLHLYMRIKYILIEIEKMTVFSRVYSFIFWCFIHKCPHFDIIIYISTWLKRNKWVNSPSYSETSISPSAVQKYLQNTNKWSLLTKLLLFSVLVTSAHDKSLTGASL